MDIFPNGEKVNLVLPKIQNQVIFYCILNWGIGHASRSIPIIERLLKENNKIIVFSDGEASRMISEYFPNLEVVALPSYNIKYDSTKFLLGSLIIQTLKNSSIIKKEHLALSKYISIYHPTMVISDNRYGCYLQNCKNIMITHQLKLKLGPTWVEKLTEYLVKLNIKPFDEVWIPDNEHIKLSGDLATPKISEVKRWIGFPSLSEFMDIRKISTDILILLSGPEPRRSELEAKYLKIIPKIPYSVTMIAGDFSKSYYEHSEGNLHFFSSKKYSETLQYIANARVVICRSGYSTLIDLFNLKKYQVICIPTLGQPEQEYLAKYWSERGWLVEISENEIDSKLIPEIHKFDEKVS